MYQSISQIKAANSAAGLYFFSPDTMRFFRSRVASSTVYGGRYFITSEQFNAGSPRLYTIRRCNDNGSIDTVGEFQGYKTLKAAKLAAKELGAPDYCNDCPECEACNDDDVYSEQESLYRQSV